MVDTDSHYGSRERELTDRILKVLEEFQSVFALIRDNTKDIEASTARFDDVEKRVEALFRTVFEGSESLVTQLYLLRDARREDKEGDKAVRTMASWFEYNKDKLQVLLDSADWIKNQMERRRQIESEPISRRALTIFAIISGVIAIISYLIGHWKP